MFSGLGLGRPSGPTSGAATLFNSSQPATPASKPASSLFSFEAAAKQTPAPSVVQPRDDTFTTPPRPAGTDSPSRPAPKTDSLAVVAEHLLADLREEIDNLGQILDSRKQFHKTVIEGNISTVTIATLNKHEQLPLSSVADVGVVVKGLRDSLVGRGQSKGGIDGEVSRLEAGMLKFDMRTGQVEQYLKAHKNSSSNAGSVKSLDPRQADLKARVEQSEGDVRSLLSDLEGMLQSLRETRSLQDPCSDGSSAIDRIGRSVKTVENAVKNRQETLEQLSTRIAGMRLASPAQQSKRSSTPTPQIVRRPDISLEAPDHIKRDVHRVLSGEDGKKDLAKRLARLSKNVKVRVVDVDGQGVKLDSVPLPGAKPSPATASPSPSVEIKKEPPASPPAAPVGETENVQVKTEPTDIPLPPETPLPALPPPGPSPAPSTPASNGISAASSGGGFGGLKFSFDLPKTDLISPTSRQHSAGRASGHSHKAHESAPRYQASPKAGETTGATGNGSADSPVRMPGGDFFVFTPKPAEGGKDAPKGFFSLSGFGNAS